jgi:hypothetical protein
MKPRNESEVLRRRAGGQRDAYEQSYQAPSSFSRPDLYMVTIGSEDGATFPTTGLNTVYAVRLLNEVPPQSTEGTITDWTPGVGGELSRAINLGEGIPVQDQTIVRCDFLGGQLFFTYRGNGSAT